jgi:adenosylhomocysteine nucleosidase
MDVEIRSILSRMEEVEAKTIGGIQMHTGKLGKKPVVLALCGVGKVYAAHAVSIVTTHFNTTSIINVGVAGGIAPEVEIGDIVLSTDLVQHDFDASATGSGWLKGQIPYLDSPFFKSGEALVRAAKTAAKSVMPPEKIHIGRIATGDQFINKSETKKEIWQTFTPLCVEMEGAAMAQICALANIPFIAIRAISDKADGTAHHDFPAFVEETAAISSAIVIKMLSIL